MSRDYDLNQKSEKWDQNPIGNVHVQIIKRILSLNRYASDAMVRGDTGRYSLKSRILLREKGLKSNQTEKS